VTFGTKRGCRSWLLEVFNWIELPAVLRGAGRIQRGDDSCCRCLPRQGAGRTSVPTRTLLLEKKALGSSGGLSSAITARGLSSSSSSLSRSCWKVLGVTLEQAPCENSYSKCCQWQGSTSALCWAPRAPGMRSDLGLEWQQPAPETSGMLSLQLGLRENTSDLSQSSTTFPSSLHPLFTRL